MTLATRTDTTLLGQGTFWKGEIIAGQEPLCIEGTVEGNIISDGTVTIAPGGRVKGTILANHLIVTGQVEGLFKVVECLEIHGSGGVEGEVETGSLVVDEGSTLQGKCSRRGFSHAPGAPGAVANASPARQPPPGSGTTGHPLRMALGLLAAMALLVAGGLAYRRHRHPLETVAPGAPPASLEAQPAMTVPAQPPAPEPR